LNCRNKDAYERFIIKKKPLTVCMGSQAFTMYRLNEFKKLGGYFDEARFYPHPEGYMPLKVWMTGKTVATHPESWHLHGMFPRSYSQANNHKIIEMVKQISTDEGLDAAERLRYIQESLLYNQPEEVNIKIAEYGGYSWSEHGVMNVFKISYILGGKKWLEICYDAMMRKHGRRRLPTLKDLAVTVVEESGEKKKLEDQRHMTLDQALTKMRKDRVAGMENWFNAIGPDPLI